MRERRKEAGANRGIVLCQRPELAVIAPEALQERHQGVMAGNLRDDPPERVQQLVPLDGHGNRKHLADLGVAEKKVRIEEESHLIAVRRRTRETLLQSPFIHGLSSAY